MGALRLDFLHRFKEIEAVAVMLLDPRRHRENIGVKYNVFRRKSLAHQQIIGALADVDFALPGVGLPNLVERHHHRRRAVIHADARLFKELRFAFFHADRIDDRLARNTFQPRLDHVEFRAVDHHRHARDIGFGGDQFEEGGHRVDRIEQPFVHVDIDHLRAVFDLLARDFHGGCVIARHDQLLERGRTGDIGAFTNIDEARGGWLGHWFNFSIPFVLKPPR